LVLELKVRRPKVLLLSPPCTYFSSLMNLNWNKIARRDREENLKEAILHLEFCCLLMDLQVTAGRHVVFEHPRGALSWCNKRLQHLMKHPGMRLYAFHMCQFGMRSPMSGLFLKKATVIMTTITIPFMRSKKCDGKHEHLVIRGNDGHFKLSVWAQRYPPALVSALAASVAEIARTHR